MVRRAQHQTSMGTPKMMTGTCKDLCGRIREVADRYVCAQGGRTVPVIQAVRTTAGAWTDHTQREGVDRPQLPGQETTSQPLPQA